MQSEKVTFTERVRKSQAPGGWTYVIWPKSVEHFGTRARVKVHGTIDGQPFASSFMPLGDGTHKLPLTGDMLRALGKGVGDVVEVCISPISP